MTNNETVKIWIDELLKSKNIISIDELTLKEIEDEILESKSSIENFRIWGDECAITNYKKYISILEKLKKRYNK